MVFVLWIVEIQRNTLENVEVASVRRLHEFWLIEYVYDEIVYHGIEISFLDINSCIINTNCYNLYRRKAMLPTFDQRIEPMGIWKLIKKLFRIGQIKAENGLKKLIDAEAQLQI